jgi:GNAT superfamily N-acetyltransferase
MPAIGGGAGAVLRRRREPPLWEYRDLTIRRYRPADHATVLALHREGLAQTGLRPGDGVYYEQDLFLMEEIYFSGGGEFLVGERDGDLVAMGGLRPAELVPTGPERAAGDWTPAEVTDTGTGELVRLRVRQDLQRRGYGAALEKALESRAAELGYRRLVCDTTEGQIAAIALYHRFGWSETHRETLGAIVNIYFVKILP